MIKIWVEKSYTNDPSWPAQYVLSEVDNYWDDPIEVSDDWWAHYRLTAAELSGMQLEAARRAGYEDE